MRALAFFEAEGRRAASIGLALNARRVYRYRWPEFARRAYARGWLNQAIREQP